MLTPFCLIGPLRSSISWDWNSQENQASQLLPFPRSIISCLHLQDRSCFQACFESAQADTCNGSSSDTNPLNRIFLKYGCNKGIAHNYPSLYHRLLNEVSSKIEILVEIGIGSPYQDGPSRMHSQYSYGSSLRGWSEYLPSAQIIGCDIDPRILINEGNIISHYIDQLNPSSILRLAQRISAAGGADVILDDGLHEHKASVTTLVLLWSSLRSGGIYLIEDMSKDNFAQNLAFLSSINLGANIFGVELASEIKDDNRVIAIIKD